MRQRSDGCSRAAVALSACKPQAWPPDKSACGIGGIGGIGVNSRSIIHFGKAQ
jgi:hypothetical protein